MLDWSLNQALFGFFEVPYIDEIEITYEINDANDPLIALFQQGAMSQLSALAGLSNLPELKFDIEIEAGEVAPSKWAHEAFHAFIPVINADNTPS